MTRPVCTSAPSPPAIPSPAVARPSAEVEPPDQGELQDRPRTQREGGGGGSGGEEGEPEAAAAKR
jgi:hypothetical protein